MKNIFSLINLIIFLFISNNIYCQEKKVPKFDISLGSGVSLPVGIYGEKNASKAAIYPDSYNVIGFAKELCGFANTGYNFNIKFQYRILSYLNLSLLTGTYSNSVETKGMSDLMTKISSEIVKEGSYKYLYILPGFGYYYSLNNLEFGLDLLMGYSITGFPYYEFIFVPFYGNPPAMFAHDGPRPNLNSFTYGISFSANYHISKHFNLGIDAIYQRANYNYTVTPRLFPAGGGSDLTFSDILKARVINAGLKIGYSF